MNKHRGDRATLLVFIIAILILIPNLAHAQAARFVASNGNDGNACTRAEPCRTLQRGVDSAAARGVVQVLDSGTYGQNLVISKSVTVLASGAATVGRVRIEGAAETVALRGLHITARGVSDSLFGTVTVTVPAIVDIENCDLDGAQANTIGLRIDVDGAKVTLVRSSLRNHASHGVIITTSSANTHVIIEDSRILNNGEGGVRNVGAGSEITIERTVIANNGVGVHTQFGGLVRISNSVVTANGVGLNHVAGSTLQSRGNNTVSGNTTNTTGTISVLGGT